MTSVADRTAPAHAPRARRRRRFRLGSELPLALATLAVFLPVALMLVLSVQPLVNIISPGWNFGFSLGNYQEVLAGHQPYLTQIGNSTVIVAGTVTLCLTAGSLAGYSLSRLGWSLRTTVLVLLAAGLITLIPPMALVPGLYLTLNNLGLLGSLLGLILLNTVFNLPFASVLMKVYFDRVPHEIRESALIDGASEFRTFLRVMLPLAAPGAAAVAIFVAIMSWNEFLFGLTMTSGGRTSPITVGIAALVQPYQITFAEMAALGSAVALPIIVLAIVANRWIVAAVTRGAVKG
jgi:ABC-type glycerol-3-phosphate transport system permease component